MLSGSRSSLKQSGVTAIPDNMLSAKITLKLCMGKRREFLTGAFTSLSVELFHFCTGEENSLQNPVDCSIYRIPPPLSSQVIRDGWM